MSCGSNGRTSLRRFMMIVVLIGSIVSASLLWNPHVFRGALDDGSSLEHRMMTIFDEDGDGDVASQEIRRGLRSVIDAVGSQQHDFDVNGDGTVNSNDLVALLSPMRSLLTAHCGDGKRTIGESCDDGNPTDGDGCSVCKIDQGAVCAQSDVGLSQCQVLCPNGALDTASASAATAEWQPELCDDGNNINDDLCTNTCSTTPLAWWISSLNAPGPSDRLDPAFEYDAPRVGNPGANNMFRIRTDASGDVWMLWSRYRSGQDQSTRQTFLSHRSGTEWQTEQVQHRTSTTAVHDIELTSRLVIDPAGDETIFFGGPIAVGSSCSVQGCNLFQFIQRAHDATLWTRPVTVIDPFSHDYVSPPAFQTYFFDTAGHGLLLWSSCTYDGSQHSCRLAGMTSIDGQWHEPVIVDNVPMVSVDVPTAIITGTLQSGFTVRWATRAHTVAFASGSPIAAQCGNGVIDAGEQCDGSELGQINGVPNSCIVGRTFADGVLKCALDCVVDTSQCTNVVTTSPPTFDYVGIAMTAPHPRLNFVVRGLLTNVHQLTIKSDDWSRIVNLESETNGRGLGGIAIDPAAPRSGTFSLEVTNAEGSAVAGHLLPYDLNN